MTMTITQFSEQINREVNKALGNIGNSIGGSGTMTVAAIGTLLTTAATAVNALTVTHSRMVEDPGPALNPSQPGP